MKIENLKVGMVIKNYKVLCELLEMPIQSGSSKKAQINVLSNCCKYHKEGQKFIIDEILSTNPVIYEKGKNPNSHGNNHNGSLKHQPQFKIPHEKFKSIGVYAIVLNHQIYIGSTNNGFRARFNQHNSKDNPLITKEMLQDEKAQFVMLKEMNNSSEFEIRLQEEEYIQHYINNTDWEVMNITSTVRIKGRRKVNEPKPKFKSIKVLETEYEKVIQLLKENGIEILQK